MQTTIDPETGEVLTTPQLFEIPEEFKNDRTRTIHWMLQKRSDMHFTIEGKKLQLQAIKDRLTREINTLENELQAFTDYSDPEIQKYLEDTLPEGKRTLVTEYAKIGFRKVPERPKIINEAMVLEYAKASQPEAVKVAESVLITKLDVPKALRECSAAFEIVPEHDKLVVNLQ